MYWTVILGFFQHMRSRNQMDMARNARAYSQTVFELSGQPRDDGDPELHTACSQTCRNFLAQVETAALERVLVQLVRHLIRSKWFVDATLWGCLCVAVDGTLCERKRGPGLADMVGNAAEWTSTDATFTDGVARKVVCGGSFNDRPHRALMRWGYPAWMRPFDVGFRIVVR